MINIYGNNKIKDYESLSPSHISKKKRYDLDYKIKRIKLLIAFVCCLFILALFVVYLIHYYNLKEKDQIKRKLKLNKQQSQNKNIITPNHTQSFSGNKPTGKKTSIPKDNTIYRTHKLKKPLDLNISHYLALLPKNNLVKENHFTELKQIFTSKKLFINNTNLNIEFIRFIRQNDSDEDQYKKMLYKSLSFDPKPIAQREGQMGVRKFYDLCNKIYIDSQTKYNYLKEPSISIIIPIYNDNLDLIRTIRSIQNQSFKNVEIIVIADNSEKNNELYNSLIKNESRLRLFFHLKNMGLWRKRLDGFLYSRGKYIIYINPGDIFADNYVLKDIYNLAYNYSLDTVRFSFSRTSYDGNFIKNKKFKKMKIYPVNEIKIIYGRPNYNVHEFGYGTLWNRLIRATMLTKGLDLVDEYILNANKNLWEDMWWNDLIDRVSFSNLIINRLGYVYFYDKKTVIKPLIDNDKEKQKTICEFIYFWYFDYQLLPKNNTKKSIVKTLKKFNKKNNKYYEYQISLYFLKSRFGIYERLLNLLINDPFVQNEDKPFIKKLYEKEINKGQKLINKISENKTKIKDKPTVSKSTTQKKIKKIRKSINKLNATKVVNNKNIKPTVKDKISVKYKSLVHNITVLKNKESTKNKTVAQKKSLEQDKKLDQKENDKKESKKESKKHTENEIKKKEENKDNIKTNESKKKMEIQPNKPNLIKSKAREEGKNKEDNKERTKDKKGKREEKLNLRKKN